MDIEPIAKLLVVKTQAKLDFSHLTEKGIDTLLTHPLKMR